MLYFSLLAGSVKSCAASFVSDISKVIDGLFPFLKKCTENFARSKRSKNKFNHCHSIAIQKEMHYHYDALVSYFPYVSLCVSVGS